MTRTVKLLLLANFACFALLAIVGARSPGLISGALHVFGMYPPYFIRGCIWQLVTYMFLHAGFWHIFGNMLVLFFFASEVERVMGRRRFLGFYFASGVTAGVCAMFTWHLPTIGASGACLGVLIAFALYFPDARVILFPLFIPIKVKYLAMFWVGITVLSLLAGGQSQTSHWGHFGGIAYALFYVKAWPYLRVGFPRLRVPRFRFGSGKGKPQSDLEVREKLDQILDKVHTQGMQSLTRKERKFLRDISKRYQR